jgi:hypothetical protein
VITVSTEQEKGQILQSHTSFVDADENYFYSFATDNGIVENFEEGPLDHTIFVGALIVLSPPIKADDQRRFDRLLRLMTNRSWLLEAARITLASLLQVDTDALI